MTPAHSPLSNNIRLSPFVSESNEPIVDAFYDVDTLNLILHWAGSAGYSDIIFTSEQKIMYRRDRLTYLSKQTELTEAQVAETVRWLGSEGMSVRALTGAYSDFAYTTPRDPSNGTRLRFRVNVTSVHSARCENALAIVMRSISSKPWELDRHNLDSGYLKYCFADIGLNLIAGPMGSGKTTLAASLIQHINTTSQKYIVSYEDPVEYDFSLSDRATIPVAQTEINRGVKTFSQALANVTRRSADVIFWGESRDVESLHALTVACDLGSAVYSTVHANSAASTISRMVRMFPIERRDGMQAALVSSMQTILFQRLLPRKIGGLVPWREYITFDDQLKEQIADLSLSQIGSRILSLQKSLGIDPLTTLIQLFQSGEISVSVYRRNKQALIKIYNNV